MRSLIHVSRTKNSVCRRYIRNPSTGYIVSSEQQSTRTRYTTICTQAKLYRGCPALGAQDSTSFPGSFILPPPCRARPRGDETTEPENEVAQYYTNQPCDFTSFTFISCIYKYFTLAFFCNELKNTSFKETSPFFSF